MKLGKTLGVIALAMLGAQTLSVAQYFSKDYTINPLEFTYGGEVSQFGDKGNLLTGQTTFSQTGYKQAVVIRTDPNGDFTNGLNGFGHTYSIWDNGVRCEVNSCFGGEVSQGLTGIAGTFKNPTNYTPFVYYSTLDANGNPVTTNLYGAVYYDQWYVSGVYNDVANSRFYILGNVWSQTTLYRDGFVICVDPTTGGIIWSNIYELGGATYYDTDIRAAALMTTTNLLALVGSYGPANLKDGFLLTVDPSNGNFSGGANVPRIFGTANHDEAFTSIINLQNAPDNGVVIGGYSNHRGNYDAWVLKYDQFLNKGSLSNQLCDYNSSNYNNRAYSVVERLSTTGANTYFLGGSVDVPLGLGATQSDVDIYKLDPGLNIITEFTEGASNTNDFIVRLDKYDGSTGWNEGLISMGSKRNNTTADVNLHANKFYFSGHLPCNNQFKTAFQARGPEVSYGIVWKEDFFFDSPLVMNLESDMTSNVLCYGSVVGGSNAKTAQGLVLENAASSQGQVALTLENPTDEPIAAEVTVSDVLGRVWVTEKTQVPPGNTELAIHTPQSGISAGVYLVTVKSITGHSTIRIFIE